MSADIEKMTVMDSRIVQQRPRFAVEKGALSLTNAPFNAIAATPSQHTYNVYVPSENVFVDRKILWTSTVYLQLTVQLNALAANPGFTFPVPGRDFALAPLPLNQLVSTLSATINDTTSVINSQDVLSPVIRLTDLKANRLVRTAPTMLDTYQNYNDAAGTVNNPLGGENDVKDYDNVPNGAFGQLDFTDNVGNPLPTANTSPAFAGATYNCVDGVPYFSAALAPAPSEGIITPSVYTYTIYCRFRSSEPIVLSPFVFSDEHEWETGLFGINNIQLIMNLQSSISRVIRQTTRSGVAITAVGYNQNVAGGQVFQNSRVNVQFLTPSLDVPLPPKSVVPYMEFPRYITQYQSGTIAAGATGQIQSQTITLPAIPDLLIVYVKPSSYGLTEGDWFMPLATQSDGVANPLSINFDNFSGLLSSMTTEQLYQMSVKNGVKMDWNCWSGNSRSASSIWTTPAVYSSPGNLLTLLSPASSFYPGAKVATVGSLLVLKPSQDITLQSGQAPSLVGNFTLQFNLTVKNNSAYAQSPQLYVITANSGFFESIRGSSRIIKGVLSEQDIIAAPIAPPMTRTELDRMVGGLSFGSLGNILSRAVGVAKAVAPHAKAAYDAYKSHSSGGDGAGMGAGGMGAGTGAGRSKKSLASRLM